MIAVLFLILFCTSAAALVIPWIGVAAYYFLALGTPQYIWPWIFQDLRASLIVSLATLVGTAVAIVSSRASFENFKNPIVWLMFILCVVVNISHMVTTVTMADFDRGVVLPLPAELVLSQFNKIVFFFFVALLIIDTEKKLRYMMLMLLAVALLHNFWANNVYLTGQLWRFGDNGRLAGPDNADENGYAAFLVALVAVPYFIAMVVKSKPVKIGLLLSVPLLWHALFLTGSRAGVIALGVVTLLIVFRSKSKLLGLLIIPAFAYAFLTQGGFLVQRVTDTVATSEVLEQGQQIDPRLDSWKVGIKMAVDNPLIGVGVSKFAHVYSV